MIRRFMAMNISMEEEKKELTTEALRFPEWKKWLTLLYLPGGIEVSLFTDAVLEDVFVGGLEA
jgi:hypothetical protein